MGEKYSSLGREFYFDIDSDIIRLGKQTMRKHCHNHFEIYYITKGNCCYFIENKAYHLVPGDIILIPAGIMHGTEYQKTIYSRKLISCSDYFIPDSVKPILPSLMHLYRNPDIVPEIDRIFDMIEEEYTKIDGMSEDIFRCYVHLLFFLLARNPNKCIPLENNKHYIDDAIDYLQENFTKNITLEQIATRYFVSAEHFSRSFKRKTGFNVSEYINILRLQKAESLLKQMNAAPITDIAVDCGFNDSNYFSIKFKELYGVPPKRFQTMHKNAGKNTK